MWSAILVVVSVPAVIAVVVSFVPAPRVPVPDPTPDPTLEHEPSTWRRQFARCGHDR